VSEHEAIFEQDATDKPMNRFPLPDNEAARLDAPPV